MPERRTDDGLLGCTVSGLAMHDVRAAAILAQRGIDICEHGLETVAEACEACGVDAGALRAEVAALQLPDEELRRLSSPWWALDELCAVLVKCHHGYFRRAMPQLQAGLAAAGATPAAVAARPLFDALVDTLTLHLVKEEHLVFPAFSALAEARRAGVLAPSGTSPHLLGPIRAMEEHHRDIDHLVEQLQEVTSDFTPSVGDAPAWAAACRDLAQFVHELRTHVRLENGLLFPRALELEREWP